MVDFGEKAKIKKAGNLNSGRSYPITTVCNIRSLQYKLYCCGSHIVQNSAGFALLS